MRSKAWLAAPVLLAHANVTENRNIFQWVQNLGTPRYTTENRDWAETTFKAHQFFHVSILLDDKHVHV